jgi:(p)ppGpp synthase/HD superfamily hydrolase
MTELTERFQEALVYAFELHRHQKRKTDNTPYFAHLMSVSALVLEDGGSEDEAIAALLHDTLEDCHDRAIATEIAARFGDRVLTIVEGCSEPIGFPKPPWCDRKLYYLEHLRSASDAVLRVSIADKLHNARSLLMILQRDGQSVWSSFHQGQTGFFWFYDALLALYRELTACSVLRMELEQVYQALRRA